MPDLNIDPKKTALLVMDYMYGTIEGNPMAQERQLILKAKRAIEAARVARIPVMFVVVSFRPQYPEISPRNKMFSTIKAAGGLQEGSRLVRVPEELAVRPDEPVIVKKRVGSFHNTDLETLLKAKDITTLVMLGISTSGVVLSTVRYAADADYDMVVLEDCCADRDAETHNFLCNNILSRQATIASSEDFIKAIAKS